MQLHLTKEELELLRQLTEERRRLSCDAMPWFAQLTSQSRLPDEWGIGSDLVGNGLSRNLPLGFDELEDLAEFLTWRENQLVKETNCAAEPIVKSELEHRLSVLNHLLEQVTEACAMV